ncbi:MAG: hypothetical protein HY877_04975, partial [Deltaproteobacteria bacterium]|nr:hypothetical protein [Deltaproteobacteria bacterium]
MTDPIVNRTSTPPVSREEAQQLQRDLLQAKKEIEQAKKWEEYYKSDFENSDRADVIFAEAKVDSLLAVIKTFLATGRWEAPAGQSGIQQGTQNDATAELIKDMKPGWNGDFLLNTNTQRPSYIPADASFEGVIYLQEGGSRAAFQLDPNAIELTAYNHGSDIIYVETLKDGTKKAW